MDTEMDTQIDADIDTQDHKSIKDGSEKNYKKTKAKFTQNRVKRKKELIGMLLLLLLVAVLIAGVRLLESKETKPESRMRDVNAIIGQVEGKSDEEIQSELNRIVEKGMFNISINSDIVMEDGTSEAELRIENVPGNQYLMGVDITLDESGEVIYSSGILEPNHYIQKAALKRPLEKGVYSATALFGAYDMEQEEKVGEAGAEIKIIVKN